MTPDIVADDATHSLISIASVEAVAVALEVTGGDPTPSGAWNNINFSELSSSASSSNGDGDDESNADGDSSRSSDENGGSVSGGKDSQLDWDFDPAREFSNRFDGPSDAEEDYSTYDDTVLGTIGSYISLMSVGPMITSLLSSVRRRFLWRSLSPSPSWSLFSGVKWQLFHHH